MGTLDRFREIAAPNLSRGCDALLSTFCFRRDHLGGAPPDWVSLSTRIVLLPPVPPTPGSIETQIFESGRFRAARGIVPGVHVPALLEGIERGYLDRESLPERWSGPILLAETPTTSQYSFEEPRYFDASSYEVQLPWPVSGYAITEYHAVDTKDVSFWNELGNLDRVLTAWDPPFAGLSGLAHDLLLPTVPARDVARAVQLISPFWLQLSGVASSPDRSQVAVTVRSEWDPLPSEVNLSVISHVDPRNRWRIPLDAEGWTTERDGHALILRRTVRTSDGPTSVCLNFGRETVAKKVTGLGSTRVVAHLVADPEAAWLRSCLIGKESHNSEAFEVAVAWLFHLLGFASVRYGYKRLQRTVDVEAFLDERAAVFAECTVEPPDSKKIDDVERRAQALMTAATAAQRPLDIIPAVFTSAGMVNAVRTTNSQVIVLPREELADLLDRALRGDAAIRIFEELTERRNAQLTAARFGM